LRPAFANAAIERHAIYWEHEANRAVRKGKWKLVAKGIDGAWELYDMESDRSETKDRAAEHPEMVSNLSKLWDRYAARANVLPLDGREWGTRVRDGALDEIATRRRFELEPTSVLKAADAPRIDGRAFRVSVSFEMGDGDGVLLAHGGSNWGYALYIEDGKLVGALRHGGKLTKVASPEKLKKGLRLATLALGPDGRVALSIGRDIVARRRAPGPLRAQPVDGLEVGRDAVGAVGEYTAPNVFEGQIRSAQVRIGHPGKL
jgi:arylsulfatase